MSVQTAPSYFPSSFDGSATTTADPFTLCEEPEEVKEGLFDELDYQTLDRRSLSDGRDVPTISQEIASAMSTSLLEDEGGATCTPPAPTVDTSMHTTADPSSRESRIKSRSGSVGGSSPKDPSKVRGTSMSELSNFNASSHRKTVLTKDQLMTLVAWQMMMDASPSLRRALSSDGHTASLSSLPSDATPKPPYRLFKSRSATSATPSSSLPRSDGTDDSNAPPTAQSRPKATTQRSSLSALPLRRAAPVKATLPEQVDPYSFGRRSPATYLNLVASQRANPRPKTPPS